MWCWFNLAISRTHKDVYDLGERQNAPEGLTWKEAWSWLEGKLLSPEHHKHCIVDLGVGYKDQCNLEFSSREIHALSDSEAALTISCYREDDWPEEKFPVRSK